MFYILAKSIHASGSDSHGLQYNSIGSFFSDFGQNILNLLATVTTCTNPKLLADLVFSSIKGDVLVGIWLAKHKPHWVFQMEKI